MRFRIDFNFSSNNRWSNFESSDENNEHGVGTRKSISLNAASVQPISFAFLFLSHCQSFLYSRKGENYLDGGLTNALPVLDERTVKVSPFAGSSHICPKDDTDDASSSTSSPTSASYASVLSSYIPDNFLSKKGISRMFTIALYCSFGKTWARRTEVCTEELILHT